MKRIILTSAVIVTIALIMIGNNIWNTKVENTTKEAEERISEPLSKETKTTNEEQQHISNEENDPQNNSNRNSGNAEKNSTSDQIGETASTSQKEVNVQDVVDSKNESTKLTDKDKTPTSHPSKDSTTAKSPNVDSSPTHKDTKPSVEEIKNKYYPLFNELKIQETSKIDQLVVQAKAEYISSNEPLSSFLPKYEQKARVLEQSADASFSLLYQQLQYDLEKNGYSLNEAQEFMQTYNAEKQARLSRIVNQISDF